MNKISSSSTFFYKRVLPIFLFGLLTIAAAAGLLIGTISIVRIVILYPVFMMGMYWLVYKRYWNLVDEVFDEGDCLLFQNGGESDRVALFFKHHERKSVDLWESAKHLLALSQSQQVRRRNHILSKAKAWFHPA